MVWLQISSNVLQDIKGLEGDSTELFGMHVGIHDSHWCCSPNISFWTTSRKGLQEAIGNSIRFATVGFPACFLSKVYYFVFGS